MANDGSGKPGAGMAGTGGTTGLVMTEKLCKHMGGTWTANPDGKGGTCSLGSTKLQTTIEFYRGDPCHENPDSGRYILVPYSETAMAALRGMKGGS